MGRGFLIHVAADGRVWTLHRTFELGVDVSGFFDNGVIVLPVVPVSWADLEGDIRRTDFSVKLPKAVKAAKARIWPKELQYDYDWLDKPKAVVLTKVASRTIGAKWFVAGVTGDEAVLMSIEVGSEFLKDHTMLIIIAVVAIAIIVLGGLVCACRPAPRGYYVMASGGTGGARRMYNSPFNKGR
jgi:hypothetical protein